MKYRFFRVMMVAAIVPVIGAAQQAKAPHVADGHPDLSGIWAYTIGLPPGVLKKQVDGKIVVNNFDRGTVRKPVAEALPSTQAPSYKPEFAAKVKDLSEHESKVDPVFYCDKPGVPRVGPPRRIIQFPNEMVFLYEDMSGDPYRVIPTDGRAHRANGNPTYYGDSVGHWEGNTLVIETTNFVDSTWFGENGYFHSDAMRVTERLWRDGENLVWQSTVEDPKVLAAPWTMAPKVVKPSTEALEESPRCVEDDGRRLLNLDHHGQR